MSNQQPQRFDAYEIRRCGEFDEESGSFTEAIGDSASDPLPPSCKRIFWTLYGHVPEAGVEAICDRNGFDDIRVMYSRITGKSLPCGERDYTCLPA